MTMRVWRLSSLRVRLALWYLLILGLTLSLFSALIFFDVRQSALASLDNALAARAATVASQVNVGSGGVNYPENNDAPSADAEMAVYLFDARRRLRDKVAGAHALPPQPRVLGQALRGHDGYQTVGGVRLYMLGVSDDGRVYGVVQAEQSLDTVAAQVNTLLTLLLLSTPALLGLATLGGVFLAARALEPIDRITRLAEAISAGNLTRRLGLAPRTDEVGRLVATFDRMLDRLEHAFVQQRRFTADASHELRTPLTIIKGDLDVLLRRRRSPEEYEEAMRDVNDEVTRLSHLIEDLLTLARTDSGQLELAFEFVSLDALIDEIVVGVRRMALAQGVTVETHLDRAVTLIGDSARLRQLALNLLSNAVTYTPAGGQVRVTLQAEARWARLEVADTGIGIAAEDLPYIFDRFFRTDKARARDGGGIGLGLSIARWCAEAHGGRIEVRSCPGAGTTFSVTLPLALPDDFAATVPPVPARASATNTTADSAL